MDTSRNTSGMLVFPRKVVRRSAVAVACTSFCATIDSRSSTDRESPDTHNTSASHRLLVHHITPMTGMSYRSRWTFTWAPFSHWFTWLKIAVSLQPTLASHPVHTTSTTRWTKDPHITAFSTKALIAAVLCRLLHFNSQWLAKARQTDDVAMALVASKRGTRLPEPVLKPSLHANVEHSRRHCKERCNRNGLYHTRLELRLNRNRRMHNLS